MLRVVLGIIFIQHAVPKLRDPKSLAASLGWHMNQVYALGIVEFIGALGLIGGVNVRLSALVLSIVMVGAIYHKIAKWKVPFSSTGGTGWEFDLMILAANMTLYLNH